MAACWALIISMQTKRAAEPGADPGVFAGQRGDAVRRPEPGGGLRLGERRRCGSRTMVGWAGAAEGLVRRYIGQDDGAEPGPGDAADQRSIWRAEEVKPKAYRGGGSRRGTRGPMSNCWPAWTKRTRPSADRPRRRSCSESSTISADGATSGWRGSRWRNCIACAKAAAYRKRDSTYQPTRPTCRWHRRAARAAAAGAARIPARGHRASRRSGRSQGRVPHQRRG